MARLGLFCRCGVEPLLPPAAGMTSLRYRLDGIPLLLRGRRPCTAVGTSPRTAEGRRACAVAAWASLHRHGDGALAPPPQNQRPCSAAGAVSLHHHGPGVFAAPPGWRPCPPLGTPRQVRRPFAAAGLASLLYCGSGTQVLSWGWRLCVVVLWTPCITAGLVLLCRCRGGVFAPPWARLPCCTTGTIVTEGADHLWIYYLDPPRQRGGSGAAERHHEVVPQCLSCRDGAGAAEPASWRKGGRGGLARSNKGWETELGRRSMRQYGGATELGWRSQGSGFDQRRQSRCRRAVEVGQRKRGSGFSNRDVGDITSIVGGVNA